MSHEPPNPFHEERERLLEQLTAERDQFRAEVKRLREALAAVRSHVQSLSRTATADIIFHLADEALASTPDAEGGVAPKAKGGA